MNDASVTHARITYCFFLCFSRHKIFSAFPALSFLVLLALLYSTKLFLPPSPLPPLKKIKKKFVSSTELLSWIGLRKEFRSWGFIALALRQNEALHQRWRISLTELTDRLWKFYNPMNLSVHVMRNISWKLGQTCSIFLKTSVFYGMLFYQEGYLIDHVCNYWIVKLFIFLGIFIASVGLLSFLDLFRI